MQSKQTCPITFFETVTKHSDFNIDTVAFVKLICSMVPSKAHSCDGMSIAMLKLCAMPISKPLYILFNNSVMNECFPNEWKKSKYHSSKKRWQTNDKKIADLWHSCPFAAKFFVKMVFDSLFKSLENNKLLTCNQSDFQPGDSCVHQLLSIARNLQIIWCQFLTWSKVLPDISKAFEQVWHDDFLYKLTLLEICGRCYNLIQSFLNNRHQRLVINVQSSKWSLIEAGVLQDWIFGPPLFFVYINVFSQGLSYK